MAEERLKALLAEDLRPKEVLEFWNREIKETEDRKCQLALFLALRNKTSLRCFAKGLGWSYSTVKKWSRSAQVNLAAKGYRDRFARKLFEKYEQMLEANSIELQFFLHGLDIYLAPELRKVLSEYYWERQRSLFVDVLRDGKPRAELISKFVKRDSGGFIEAVEGKFTLKSVNLTEEDIREAHMFRAWLLDQLFKQSCYFILNAKAQDAALVILNELGEIFKQVLDENLLLKLELRKNKK